MCKHEDESARMVARLEYKLARDARDDAADRYTEAEGRLRSHGEVPADV